MTANRKRTRTGKRDLYLEEAQSLYLAGKSLEEIQELFPVALSTLQRWHKEGRWDEKRLQVLVSPRWLGEALKGLLREKTGRLLIQGELKPQELDELTKILTLNERLCSQGSDLKAASLEVMDRFSEFLRSWVTDAEEMKIITGRIQEFFRNLENDGELGK
jgi:transposase